MKKHWFSFLLIASFIAIQPLAAAEPSRSENLKTLFQEQFPDIALEMLARQSAEALEKEIDPSFLASKLREEIYKEPLWSQLAASYSQFSDEEIADLASILTSPLYKKFMKEGMESIMANLKIIQDAFSNLAQSVEAGPSFAVQKSDSSAIIEVTSENFASVVEQSDVPVIIDIYATWCPPCKRLAPILEKASESNPQIRFVKINADEQPELASRFKVRQLPTLLFFLPKESAPSLKSVGLLTEKALDEKIGEFQKLF